MSVSKKAALMAIFAAVEDRVAEELSTKTAPPPWERGERPIEVDLAALRRRRRRKPA